MVLNRGYKNILQAVWAYPCLWAKDWLWVHCRVCRTAILSVFGKLKLHFSWKCIVYFWKKPHPFISNLFGIFSLIEFFNKMKKWEDMANLPSQFRERTERLERNFTVSAVIFKKYEPIFQDIFRYPQEDQPRQQRGRKQRYVSVISRLILEHYCYKNIMKLLGCFRCGFDCIFIVVLYDIGVVLSVLARSNFWIFFSVCQIWQHAENPKAVKFLRFGRQGKGERLKSACRQEKY